MLLKYLLSTRNYSITQFWMSCLSIFVYARVVNGQMYIVKIGHAFRIYDNCQFTAITDCLLVWGLLLLLLACVLCFMVL